MAEDEVKEADDNTDAEDAEVAPKKKSKKNMSLLILLVLLIVVGGAVYYFMSSGSEDGAKTKGEIIKEKLNEANKVDNVDGTISHILKEDELNEKDLFFYMLPEITSNILSKDGTRHTLKTVVTLEVKGDISICLNSVFTKWH